MVNYADILSTSQEDPGTVLRILEYFDRPRNAIAAAVFNAMDDDEKTTFLQGLARGISGEQKTSWGDVFGVESGIGRFGLDVLLDPLNLIPITGAGKLIGKGAGAAHDVYMGSRTGKMFGGHWYPESAYKPVSMAEQEILQKSGGLREGYEQTRQAMLEQLTPLRRHDPDIDYNLRKAYEEGGIKYGTTDLPPELTGLMDEFAGHKTKSMNLVRESMERAGYEAPELLEGVDYGPEAFRQYFPHVWKGPYKQVDPKEDIITKGGLLEGLQPRRHKRELRSFVRKADLEGDEFTSGRIVGGPFVGKPGQPASLKKAQIVETPEGYFHKQPGTGIIDPEEYTPIIASMDDVIKAARNESLGTKGRATFVRGRFVDDVVETMDTAFQSDLDQANFYMLQNALKGVVLPKFGTKALITGDDIAQIPREALYEHVWSDNKIEGIKRLFGPKYRRVRVQSTEDIMAPAALANYLENIAGTSGNIDVLTSSIERASHYLMTETKAGQYLNQLTNWSKRNLLGLFPGYYFANIVSDLTLIYGQAGTKAFQYLPDGVKLKEGIGKIRSVFPDNQIRKAAKDMKVISRDPYSMLIGKTKREGYFTELLKENWPNKATDTLGAFAKKWGDANDWAFRNIGGRTEDYSRGALFVHYLNENAQLVKEGARSFDDLAREAAVFAKEGMIDYGHRTFAEEFFFKKAFPFWTWYRGYMQKFIQDTIHTPHRAARLGRFLDTMFDPVPESIEEMTPDYFRARAPVIGSKVPGLSKLFEGETRAGLPKMMLLGRFLAPGTAEEMVHDPLRQGMGMINPLMKTPLELLTNQNWWKGRQIDPLAEGAFRSVINPVIGGPYSQHPTSLMGMDMPAGVAHAIQGTPASRYITGMVDPAMRGLGLFDDPIRGPTSLLEQGAYIGTGGKAYGFDEEKWRSLYFMKESKKMDAVKRRFKYYLGKGDIDKAQHMEQQIQKLMEDYKRRSAIPLSP